MKQLGYFENLLYKNQQYINALSVRDKQIFDNLDSVSNYFQNREKSLISRIVTDTVSEILSVDLDQERSSVAKETAQIYGLFSEFTEAIFKTEGFPRFSFIDLFAGIGGFRLACQANGGECVFSSEWDPDAKKTYYHNFGEYPFGDITAQRVKDCIPGGFDLLCAGFPCQAFSIAGYRKGFEDTRGTLFFDVATIIKERRPKAFLLENVKNLVSHDNGRTFEVIYNTLNELGYKVFYKVLNTMEYANIPQNRERIFIVGFDPEKVEKFDQFTFPEKKILSKTIHDCIDEEVNDYSLFYTEDSPYYDSLIEEIKDPDTVYQWRRQYVRTNKSNVCPTLTANMGTGGHNVPLILTKEGIRKLTPKECLNFQGFPAKYEFPPIAKSKQYKQAGNSVTVPLIREIVKNIVALL